MAHALTEKIALITGGAQGIGRGITDALAAAGAIVVIGDISIAEDDAGGRSKLFAPPERSMSLNLDVSRSDSVSRCVARILHQFGRIDILVNNAGIAQPKDILQITEEDWDRVMSVNLKGSFLCCKAVIPEMIKQRWGRIINISSISAQRGALYGHVHYSASKAGQLGLTRSLARWCADKGITVNAIAPGSVETQTFAGTVTTQQRERVINDTPVRRLGKPREIGSLVSWLCSDDASFVTGAVLDINGGAWMG
jgi:NAD(P)-dependent dehydrogenase (short-subunit alcohol dehydrogenase family)